jgi:hypothetical protein
MKKTIIEHDVTVDPELFSQHTYYETDIGIISLMYPCVATQHMFEINCIKGDFFNDIEMYFTLEEAERRIIELIGNTFKYGK